MPILARGLIAVDSSALSSSSATEAYYSDLQQASFVPSATITASTLPITTSIAYVYSSGRETVSNSKKPTITSSPSLSSGKVSTSSSSASTTSSTSSAIASKSSSGASPAYNGNWKVSAMVCGLLGFGFLLGGL
ncbi:unnamed protein product [Kuraishia capsulata CBS 1993]|uniref:Uncharacterized protein n=1 Tax=Kuraishia capsulata CBS 1993 TaxID=1382522 RepID=W6MLS6_9ASCO|nr:uncharacterized protein KUCA_T00003434001 [Kuraishia capsulata CBS 1993]CDK27456.1 unnamed protein product [Kuraishia capsulata CBS 1993]